MDKAAFQDGAAYVKGAFVPMAEAVIPVTDWGFTRSDCVYDVVHVWRNGFFRLDDHLDRFVLAMAARKLAARSSARTISSPMPCPGST
jgi:branched-chain amino acid aminotransferase